MNPKKNKKTVDYSKINIGLEMECFVVKTDSLKGAGKEDSQKIFKTLIDKFGWTEKEKNHGEIQAVDKKIENSSTDIKLDLSYSIFEIANASPVFDLQQLEKINKQALAEFRSALKENDFLIWPFGVAPASTGLLNLPHKTSEEIVADDYYAPINRWDNLKRLCHITSHQINIDVPLDKMIPAINAFYKNLGNIIEKFSNSPAYFNGRLYREGRYYWWLDATPNLKRWKIPTFPDHEFKNWDDFYTWVFEGLGILVRDNLPYGFRGGTVYDEGKATIHTLLRNRKVLAIDPEGKDVELELKKEDIEYLFQLIWIDFKPHFDFDQNYTLEEFLDYYEKHNLDGFFEKYCRHAWLEIRPCSPHFEDNAMILPRYFYDIIMNLNEYIENSKKISWEDAREARDRAIGYIV